MGRADGRRRASPENVDDGMRKRGFDSAVTRSRYIAMRTRGGDRGGREGGRERGRTRWRASGPEGVRTYNGTRRDRSIRSPLS